MSFTKNLSLGAKLRFAFISIMSCTIIIATSFSIIYFSGKMEEVAVKDMRKNIDVAGFFYNSKQNDVRAYCKNLSNDKGLQILMEIGIRNKLSDLIKDKVRNGKSSYAISILNKDFEHLCFVARADNSLMDNATIINEHLFTEALKSGGKDNLTATELIQTKEGKNILSITSYHSVKRDKEFIGIVVVRYVLNDNPEEILGRINTHLDVSAALFVNNKVISSIGENIIMDTELYEKAESNPDQYNELTDIHSGSVIVQYAPILDYNENTAGVMGIFVSSRDYMKIIIRAIVTFVGIMILMLMITIILANSISKSITVPVNNLLKGVKIIAAGNYKKPISMGKQEEINTIIKEVNIMAQEIEVRTKEIQDKNIELQAHREELESFVYTTSHDLKTPLVSLHLLIGRLLEENEDKLTKDSSRLIERVFTNINHSETLINSLQEISQIGRISGPVVEIKLKELFEELAEEFELTLKESNIKLNFKAKEDCAIQADKNQIIKVMDNLITNAIKFMGDTNNPKIELSCFCRGKSRVQLCVKDNGAGIDPKYHEKIFELFQILNPGLPSKGPGAGLALVKKTVETLGGRIWVESELGKGSEFWVELPS